MQTLSDNTNETRHITMSMFIDVGKGIHPFTMKALIVLRPFMHLLYWNKFKYLFKSIEIHSNHSNPLKSIIHPNPVEMIKICQCP
jgi:hypothetical protein